MDHKHRRLVAAELTGPPMGAELAVAARLLPGEPTVIVLVEPQLLGRAPHALEVPHRAVGDEAAEAGRDVVDGEPVHHVAAEARPRRGDSVGIDERQLHRGIEAGDEVAVALPPPVAGDLVDESLAEAGRPARVGHDDDVAARGPQFWVPAVAPAVLPGALRTTVHEIDDGPLLRGVESRWLEDPHLHLHAPLDRHVHRAGAGEIESGKEPFVGPAHRDARRGAAPAGVDGSHRKHFRRGVHPHHLEGGRMAARRDSGERAGPEAVELHAPGIKERLAEEARGLLLVEEGDVRLEIGILEPGDLAGGDILPGGEVSRAADERAVGLHVGDEDVPPVGFVSGPLLRAPGEVLPIGAEARPVVGGLVGGSQALPFRRRLIDGHATQIVVGAPGLPLRRHGREHDMPGVGSEGVVLGNGEGLARRGGVAVAGGDVAATAAG